MATAATTKEAPTETRAGDEEPSMEEILQSIRKIIAEDETDGKKPADAAAASDVPGSSILELTEMLTDDGTVVSITAEEPPAEAAPADVLNTIDEALVPEKPPEPPTAKAPEKAPEPPVEKAVEKPAEKPVAALPPAAAPADSLLSSDAASAASDAFRKLKTVEPEPAASTTTPAPSFRSGVTMEDMVTDMLRPMMKAWLDANLPAIVERIVEREVKKLTR